MHLRKLFLPALVLGFLFPSFVFCDSGEMAVGQRSLLTSSIQHNVYSPRVEIPMDRAEEDAVNALLKSTIDELYHGYDSADEVSISFEVTYQEYPLLSIRYEIYSHTQGAAHPTITSFAQTIDLSQRKNLDLAGVFSPGYQEKLDTAIIDILKQRENYSPCAKDEKRPLSACYSTISAKTGFYLKDKDIVFAFPTYEIAPGVHGPIDVAVSITEISDLLQPKSPISEVSKEGAVQ